MMRELPSLESLRDFLVFAEELNLTRTARKVNLSQPALHLRLARLSEQLGVVLYRRQGRALALTGEGRRVVRFARQIVGRTGAFLDDLTDAGADRVVTLTGGEGVVLNLLAPAVRAFPKLFTGTLRVTTRDAPGTLEAVLAGESQLGVGAFDETPPEVRRQLLARVGYVVVVPRTHRLAARKHVRLSDMANESIIVPPTGRPFRLQLDTAFRDRRIPWSVAVEASGWEVMLRFVQLGLGIALVSEFCRVASDLVAVGVAELEPLEYSLVTDRTNPPRGASAALQALILEHRDDWRAPRR